MLKINVKASPQANSQLVTDLKRPHAALANGLNFDYALTPLLVIFNWSAFSVSFSLCSYSAVCDFLVNNNLLSVIRAHEAQDAG